MSILMYFCKNKVNDLKLKVKHCQIKERKKKEKTSTYHYDFHYQQVSFVWDDASVEED